MGNAFSLSELKEAYEKNENIMKLLREDAGNSPLAIQVSYELQSGSYTKIAESLNTEEKKLKTERFRNIAKTITPFIADCNSILEAGIGEATSFTYLIDNLSKNFHEKDYRLSGFDISWSRLYYAKRNIKKHLNTQAELFTADLQNIPLCDNSVDMVFTNAAIEPNLGREKLILSELYRICAKTLIIIEPDYERADGGQKKRMEEHGYCRNLGEIIKNNGWTVKIGATYQTLSYPLTLRLIRKEETNAAAGNFFSYICPACKTPLIYSEDNLFCPTDGVIYPIIKDIFCLLKSNAILAVKYMDGEFF
ncbi:MAG: methyltransferase domain-containing protein [Deferribacteraceae bacterium]|jgi:hypothetical protein|nr:methyltransferase domain-containing protein [Deferribacteraceae bacterium]